MSKLKGQKGFSVVEIFLAVTIISVLVIVTWLFMGQRKKAEQAVVQPDKTTESVKSCSGATVDVNNSTDLVDNIKNSLAAKYKLVEWSEGKYEPSQDCEIVYQLSDLSPAYKSEGLNFYVQFSGSGSKGIRLISKAYDPNATIPHAEDIAVRQEVIRVFEAYGLKKIDAGTYSGNDLVCTTEEPTSSLIAQTEVLCGRLSALKERAAQEQPIAKALPNSEGVIIRSAIKNSEISGYQYATASVSSGAGGGYIAYLYREGNKDWVYWKGTQETPQCKLYDTNLLKSAFKGIECKDENFKDSKL